MLAGVRAGASMVTPNEREAEELVGQEFADGSDLATGLLELVRLGAEEAAITRPEGCVAAVGESSERRLLEVHTEPLEPVSTVGSGDAFVAGYVAARYEGRSAGGVPRLRRRLRGRVDPALRRRHRRPQPGRAAARRGLRARFGGPGRSVGWLVQRQPWRTTLGNRNRPRKERAARLRIRRRRDRSFAPHAGPRRHRHHLDPRSLPLRPAPARLGDGRRGQPRDRGARQQARRPRGAQPGGHLEPASRTPKSGSRRSPRRPSTKRRG